MKSLQRTIIIITVILVITQFLINLLTNYASVDIPIIFEKYPSLLWISILICLIIILSTTLVLGRREEHPKNVTAKQDNKNNSSELGNAYDIFISYSHHQFDWVHNSLVPKLENHGFNVLIDSKFVAGKFGIAQIEDGVLYCKHVIAVLTPEYIVSEWATLENTMAQTLDPAARNRKLIPILLKDTELPPRFKMIHYRDFRNTSDEKWNQLIQDLI